MKRRAVILWTLTLAAGLAAGLALAAGTMGTDQAREAHMQQAAMATKPAPTGPAPLDQAQPQRFQTTTFAMG